MRLRLAILILIAISATASPRRRAVGRHAGDFANPEAVTIRGYAGDAMEPFLTRDGLYLLFNDSNAPGANTDLHYAERIDSVTFDYRGKINGVNSAALDAVASVDASGRVYFVSTRSYNETLSSIYRGEFESGRVTGVSLVNGISKNTPGAITFDVEVSAGGETLYLSDGMFTGGDVPSSADLAAAVRVGDRFERVSSEAFANVNTDALEYAACLSAGELELFFTRFAGGSPAIYRSVRGGARESWSRPERIDAIAGFAEAPSLSPDGRSLYYHARRGSHFVIERVRR
jgi:hypothetical protein